MNAKSGKLVVYIDYYMNMCRESRRCVFTFIIKMNPQHLQPPSVSYNSCRTKWSNTKKKDWGKATRGEKQSRTTTNLIRVSTSLPLPPFPCSCSPFQGAPSSRPSPCSSHSPSCDCSHLNRYSTVLSVAHGHQKPHWQAQVAPLPLCPPAVLKKT